MARKFFRLWYFCMFFFSSLFLIFVPFSISLLWVPRFNGLSYNLLMTLNVIAILENTLVTDRKSVV